MLTVNFSLKGNVIYSRRIRNQPMGTAVVIFLSDMLKIESSILDDIYRDYYWGHTYVLERYKKLAIWLIVESRPMASMTRIVKVGKKTVYRRMHVNIFDCPHSLLSDFIIKRVDGVNTLNIYADCNKIYMNDNGGYALERFLYYHQHCKRPIYNLISPVICEYVNSKRCWWCYMKPVKNWLFCTWWKQMWMIQWFIGLPVDVRRFITSIMKKIFVVHFECSRRDLAYM